MGSCRVPNQAFCLNYYSRVKQLVGGVQGGFPWFLDNSKRHDHMLTHGLF